MRKQIEDPDLQADISRAIESLQTVLDAANDAIDKEQLASAFRELDERVDDWKALKIDSFGDLLRFGTFTVIKGDSGKDSEREVSTTFITRCLENLESASFVRFILAIGHCTSPHMTKSYKDANLPFPQI